MSFQAGDEQQQAAQPSLCERGCGFFSNVGCEGQCSKCYREHQAELQNQAKAKECFRSCAQPAAASEQPAAAAVSPQPEPAAAPSSSAPAAAESTPESTGKTSTRCQVCRKKVGLTGFKCRCSSTAVFCGQHRYAEAHDCCFDYRKMQQEKIAAANPLVQASKVDKI